MILPSEYVLPRGWRAEKLKYGLEDDAPVDLLVYTAPDAEGRYLYWTEDAESPAFIQMGWQGRIVGAVSFLQAQLAIDL